MRHQVRVHPADHPRIHIRHLKQRWHLWVTGAALGKDHIPDPLLVALRHHDAHPRLDVQKQRIAACGGRGVVDAHPLIAGADVLAVSGGPVTTSAQAASDRQRHHKSVTISPLSNKKPPLARRSRCQLGTDF